MFKEEEKTCTIEGDEKNEVEKQVEGDAKNEVEKKIEEKEKA